MALSTEELHAVAAEPVPGDSPAGKDVRLEPDFMALQSEIDKLNSMTGAAGGVNWANVETLASKILKESSKDILAAVYLAAALGETDGPAGITEGAGFLAEFVQGWWPQLLPPIKRMRARVNAVEWWRDRTVQLLEKYAGPPVPQSAVDAAKEAVERLDKILGETSEGLPTVREVAKNLPALPVAAEAPPPPETPAAAPGPGAAGAPADSSPVAGPVQGTQGAQGAPGLSPAPDGAAGSAVALPPPPAAAKPGEGLDSPGAAAALKAVSGALDAYLSFFYGSFESPRYWDLSRTRLWLAVESPPPAENGKTMLQAPPGEILAGLKSLLGAGRFKDCLASAEDKRVSFVFWLDLDMISAKALEGAGFGSCAAALAGRVSSFASRLPGITDLAFDDGTPFASQDAKDWLASAGAGGGGGAGPSETALYDRYLEGDAAKSLSDLGEAAARPRSGREALLARAAEMRLYMRTGRAVEAAALARWAVAECGRLELCLYDPGAAAKAMQAAVQALKVAGPEFKSDYLAALANLALCGPRAVSDLPPAEIL
ncbi:MAG: type VI secretion system protein TssA [Deltaproteobacteria bacterium]|jgi:type VI secretion system protein VasJ|nr:type VI secretion system protein TssA [Deltaproteobacteria bacterium]